MPLIVMLVAIVVVSLWAFATDNRLVSLRN
jgi:hypothetical protein